MLKGARRESEEFEDEVRRIARELWPQAAQSGSKKIGGREYDGYFETDECIHLLEATTSRKKFKAEKDCKKLFKLEKKLSLRALPKVVVCWFVTKDEPTADQRSVAEGRNVRALSFSQFRNQLIDSKSYLTLRDKHVFGSVRDPGTGHQETEVEYIPMDALEIETNDFWSVEEMTQSIMEGTPLLLLGDYGAGKSMTLREIYSQLRASHFAGHSSKFPVYINLREHWGQTEPVEILERHARTIGYSNPHHLVRAWRSGFAILLLDGFDELASTGIQGLWKRLRDLRYRTMEPLRKIVREQPAETGLILSGRAHYFDSADERTTALNLRAKKPKVRELTLSEFTEAQVQEYLQKAGVEAKVPDWMPRRPLLVGYLASQGLLVGIAESKDEEISDAAAGWDQLLRKIANREADIESGIDATSIRRILERLASFARSTTTGRGPIRSDELKKAFYEICFYDPDETGMLILQRLPGLGTQPEEPGSRMFIDEDFADACRAGDLYRLLLEPYSIPDEILVEMDSTLGALGISVTAYRARRSDLTAGNIEGALNRVHDCVQHDNHEADLLRVALELEVFTGDPILIRDVLIDDLLFDARSNEDLDRITFRDSLIEKLELVGRKHSKLPVFEGCYIGLLECPVFLRDKLAEGNEIENIQTTDLTTDALMEIDLPTPVNVLLTILKKLFRQSGSGRQESALRRGLDHKAARYVSDIVGILQQEDFIAGVRLRGNRVWVPNGDMAQRVNGILNAPRVSRDIVVQKCEEL